MIVKRFKVGNLVTWSSEAGQVNDTNHQGAHERR